MASTEPTGSALTGPTGLLDGKAAVITGASSGNGRGIAATAELVEQETETRAASGQTAVYSTSKGAVRLLTYALGDALGRRGVRVNAIHPGYVETAMTQQDTGGDPGAAAAVFLASDLAADVNGTSLVVDGGVTAV